MSNNDSDGCEDGQIVSPTNSNDMNFSLSDEDLELDSSLHIKPPQLVSSRTHKASRKKHGHDKHSKHSSRRHSLKDKDKHKRHRSSDADNSNPDRILEDLRSRLLDKRNRHKIQGLDDYRRPNNDDVKRHKYRDVENHRRQRDKPAVEYYERKSKKDLERYSKDKVDVDDDYEHKRHGSRYKINVVQDKRTSEAELESNYEQKHKVDLDKLKKSNVVRDTEYDERRDRLLVAEREMLRLKKLSRLQLQARRDFKTRKCLEDEEAISRKKQRRSSEDNLDKNLKDTNVVMVSDDTEEETANSTYDSDQSKSDDSEEASDAENSEGHSDDKHQANSRSCSESETSSESQDDSNAEDQKGDMDVIEILDTKVDDKEQLKVDTSNLKSTDGVNNTEQDKNNEANDLKKYPPYYPGIQGCRSVAEFQCLNRIEEGTYGVVYRAKDLRTGEVVALKRLKMEKEKEGFPITSLREINTLLKAQHPNIVTVREIVVGSNMDKIFIVMDYVEHDLKSLMETMKHKKQGFLPSEVKCLVQQLLKAVAHLHDNWILHRDLKTSNLLLSHKGILKVGDFGLAREYGSPLRAYTPIVVTLWYRSPELLLGCKEYSTAIDMWSVGCIFAELVAMQALFPGKSEVDQLNRIFKDLGTPNEKIWPGYSKLPAVQKMTFTEYPVSMIGRRFAQTLSPRGLDLLNGFLTYDPDKRITSEEALQHNYFKEVPLPIDPAMFPTWPAKSELGTRRALASSPKPPSGGDQFKALGEGEGADAYWGERASLLDTRHIPMGAGFSLKF
uniref:cyclin-dependent kinase n=1 Tax=Xenopsylla cheopis TaxID=163159 RepID=A0A6M2DK56_XENCH